MLLGGLPGPRPNFFQETKVSGQMAPPTASVPLVFQGLGSRELFLECRGGGSHLDPEAGAACKMSGPDDCSGCGVCVCGGAFTSPGSDLSEDVSGSREKPSWSLQP